MNSGKDEATQREFSGAKTEALNVLGGKTRGYCGQKVKGDPAIISAEQMGKVVFSRAP